MKTTKSDFEYLVDFNFQARDFKFVSNVGFHVSITTVKSDFEYLVNMRPNLAKSGLAWTNMA